MEATAEHGCYFCGTQQPRMINGAHWIANPDEKPHGGHWERVDACTECCNAGRFQKPPRRPRKPRVVNMATDWNMLVAFTQAQGKQARRTQQS